MTEPNLHLYNLALPELEALLSGWGQPAFRARQIFRQSYVNLVDDPLAMTDLPGGLRERLAAELRWRTLELVRVLADDDGLTRKAVFRLPGGELIESVLMVYPDRATVCVSTQAGCAMGCVFCATGRLGLLRNVTTGQIVEQVIWAARELQTQAHGSRQAGAAARSSSAHQPAEGEDGDWWQADQSREAGPGARRLTNVVFMGMGEPFANYDRWWGAVELLHSPQGLNMGARSMTVSTVGLPQGIRRLAGERLPINLAISLHAPDDELRSEMMPVNRRFPLAELMDATRTYVSQTNRRVSFEYVLLQGRNDEPQHAIALAKLLRGQGPLGELGGMPLQLTHVNLIPWNPVPGMPLGRSDWERVLAFQRELHARGVGCTVRVERGIAIAAACGQLAGAADTINLTAG
jgi:23S rRNA (adenine2503-C2)-methyltransferase